MENKKEYLTEENYESGKKKIKIIALVTLVIGILIGGSIIGIGLIKQKQVNFQYSEENKNNIKEQLELEMQQLTQELDAEKQNLLTSKSTLENKIKPIKEEIKKLEREKSDAFRSNGYNWDKYYEIEDKIEELNESIKNDENSLSIIEDALDDRCSLSKIQDNTYTSKYCSLKDQVTKKDDEIEGLDREFTDFNKEFDSFDSIFFYMIGGFIILVSVVIASNKFRFAKGREFVAFTTQQVMPIEQEKIEKMSPTVGKAAGTIGKEIAKGIKDGINDANEEKE